MLSNFSINVEKKPVVSSWLLSHADYHELEYYASSTIQKYVDFK